MPKFCISRLARGPNLYYEVVNVVQKGILATQKQAFSTKHPVTFLHFIVHFSLHHAEIVQNHIVQKIYVCLFHSVKN
jgi:hypothetical protein